MPLRLFQKWGGENFLWETSNFFLDIFVCFDIIIKLSHDREVNVGNLLEQRWRSRLVGRGRMIGNHVNLNGFRGFESLLLRQKETLEPQWF